jgi:hypothetical protein
LTWGWSEGNLSNTCGDPAGFCNHGLYLAESSDGGNTWTNADRSASVSIATGPIAYNDPRFAVVAPTVDVGVYKAIAVAGPAPGTPWIVYQPGADLDTGAMAVAHPAGGGWVRHRIDASRAWNDSVVARMDADGHLVAWADIAQSGSHRDDLQQWVVTPAKVRRDLVPVGPNWFLTGIPLPNDREALVWRAGRNGSGRDVGFQVVRAP